MLRVAYLVEGGLVLKDVELDGFSEGSALANSNHITLSDIGKARRAVDRHIGVPLLESGVKAVESDVKINNIRKCIREYVQQ